ncbi:MAG TPA: CopD family protein [Gemmatimonadales bacterium]|nr:CopD family protein [Gemmatimonadales bacterium]
MVTDLGWYAMPAVRALILLALMLLWGTATAAFLVVRAGVEAHPVIAGWLRRLPGLFAWFLLTLSLCRGALQVLAFSDPGMPADPDLARAVLTTGSWGAGWITQTLVAFVLLALSWRLRDSPVALRWTVVIAATALLLAQAGMGHGADPFWSPAIAGRMVHFTHLLGAGTWIGTLAVLSLAVFPSLRGEDRRAAMVAVLDRFSLLARTGAALIVASGGLALLVYTNSLRELFTAPWGRLVLAKIALTGLVAVAGYLNWKVNTPRIAGGAPDGSQRLRRAVVIELALAMALIVVTGILVGLGTPRDS